MDAGNGDKPKTRWRVPRFHLISLLMGVLAAGWWLGMNLNRSGARVDTDIPEPMFGWGFPLPFWAWACESLFWLFWGNAVVILIDLALGLAFTVYVLVTIERSLKRTAAQSVGWRGPFKTSAVACGWLMVMLLLAANSTGEPSGADGQEWIAEWYKYAEQGFPDDLGRLKEPLRADYFPEYRSYGWPFAFVKFRVREINHGAFTKGLKSIEFLPLLADLAIAIAILLASMNVVERLTGAKPRASPGAS